MLQIISIYKAADRAPLCRRGRGRRPPEHACWRPGGGGGAPAPPGKAKIAATSLQIRTCQLELSMAAADFRNLCNYSC